MDDRPDNRSPGVLLSSNMLEKRRPAFQRGAFKKIKYYLS